MAYFSKFKIGSTTYDVKDASAGKTLALNGSTLELKNAAGTVVSSVNLPGGGSGANIFYLEFSVSTSPAGWNSTNLSFNDIYDSAYQQADWNDIDDYSVFYGVIIDETYDPDVDMYIVPFDRYLQGGASTNLVILSGKIPVFDSNVSRVVPVGYAYLEGCYNKNMQLWSDTMQGKYEAVGGGSVGPISLDLYDSAGSYQLGFSNLTSLSQCKLKMGNSFIQFTDLTNDLPGPFVVRLTDGYINVVGIDTNYSKLYIALNSGGSAKVSTIQNQWSDNWNFAL